MLDEFIKQRLGEQVNLRRNVRDITRGDVLRYATGLWLRNQDREAIEVLTRYGLDPSELPPKVETRAEQPSESAEGKVFNQYVAIVEADKRKGTDIVALRKDAEKLLDSKTAKKYLETAEVTKLTDIIDRADVKIMYGTLVKLMNDHDPAQYERARAIAGTLLSQKLAPFTTRAFNREQVAYVRQALRDIAIDEREFAADIESFQPEGMIQLYAFPLWRDLGEQVAWLYKEKIKPGLKELQIKAKVLGNVAYEMALISFYEVFDRTTSELENGYNVLKGDLQDNQLFETPVSKRPGAIKPARIRTLLNVDDFGEYTEYEGLTQDPVEQGFYFRGDNLRYREE